MKTLIAGTLAAIALLAAAPAQAQNVNESVKKNTAFSLSADHDGANTDHFNLYLDGALVQTVPVANVINGTIEFSFPAGIAAVGVHVFFEEAVGPTGTVSDPSNTVTMTVLDEKPIPPGRLRKKQ